MFRHLQCIIYFFVQRHLAASRPSRGRRNMQRWPKQIQTLPQTWLYQPLDQNSKIPLKWNMKSSQNKSSSALPQIWLWKRSTLKLSVSFQALCDKVKWTKAVAVKSPCTWEGWAVVSAQFGDQEVTQFGLYFFRIHSQGVVALVSVSEGKTQITILILRRGTCLITWGKWGYNSSSSCCCNSSSSSSTNVIIVIITVIVSIITINYMNCQEWGCH